MPPGMRIRTVELFAGVGGFRLGLKQAGPEFDTVWWNQWEPGAKVQHAWKCYVKNWHDGDENAAPALSNTDISKVPAKAIPPHDLLVGGFPCQDYSVATTLDKAGGLQGKKGVLWWEIDRIVKARKPPYIILENVDRLLKSPAQQRGRDFGVVLACLRDAGYRVEWRVINAAEYGHPQRRRRTFIFAAHKSTAIGKRIAEQHADADYLESSGFFPGAFPVSFVAVDKRHLDADTVLPKSLKAVSDSFEYPFQNAGVMVDGDIHTRLVDPVPQMHKPTIEGLLVKTGVDARYLLDEQALPKWKYQKGAKRILRTAKNGHQYHFTEGGMQFPDLPNQPARTILTSEANRTPNRSTHIVQDPATGKLRFLTPLEVERLMGFDDDWTEGIPERWRYFTMGNALVVPVVAGIGQQFTKWLSQPRAAAPTPRLPQRS
ncbi:MAG TPA: DNA (cytosine-5-)-methyltransferase [Candidatus Thermoplasmatota archaeon]|nr:DNA (cytosine-5-)-methyltransferase [Candidatus Thermoplasmatota archaeon]